MGETIRINRKDLTAREVVSELNDGNRVIIELEIIGKTVTMALRRRNGTYYCDTPMKLLTFESAEAMEACLERYRLARSGSADDDGGDEASTSIPE